MTQRTVAPSACKKVSAAILGECAAGKGNQHDQTAELPPIIRVRNRAILAAIPPAEKLLAGDSELRPSMVVEERAALYGGRDVNTGNRAALTAVSGVVVLFPCRDHLPDLLHQ